MTPTNYLRFVEKCVVFQSPERNEIRRSHVLQQWWHENDEPPPSSRGEWRDVPLEAE